MLYWASQENVINVVRDQKVGTTIVLQDVQEMLQKVHEGLSNTWAKLEYVRQKRSDKIRDSNADCY